MSDFFIFLHPEHRAAPCAKMRRRSAMRLLSGQDVLDPAAQLAVGPPPVPRWAATSRAHPRCIRRKPATPWKTEIRAGERPGDRRIGC